MFLKRTAELLDRVEKNVLVWTILGLALIGCVQVVTRYVFNYSFTWYEELGRYLGVFVAFLGASIGVKSSSHFAMDFFVLRLSHPRRQMLKSATSFLSGSFFLMVAYYSWKIVIRNYGYETTSPTMEIPMYVAYLPIPIFSMVMGVRFFGVGISHLRSLGKGDAASAGEPV